MQSVEAKQEAILNSSSNRRVLLLICRRHLRVLLLIHRCRLRFFFWFVVIVFVSCFWFVDVFFVFFFWFVVLKCQRYRLFYYNKSLNINNIMGFYIFIIHVLETVYVLNVYELLNNNIFKVCCKRYNTFLRNYLWDEFSQMSIPY